MYCKCADSASYFCAVTWGQLCIKMVYVYKEKIVPPYPTLP